MDNGISSSVVRSAEAVASNNRSGLTLESLQSIALSHNPTIAQALAQVDAAQGAAFQAGLPRNPQIGYVAEQIGVNGTAGELQGGFVSQEFVRGNKLGLSRAKYCERVSIAQTNLAAQQTRVKNDVAVRFYHTLGAQLIVEVHQRMVETAHDNVLTHREMLNMGQTGEAEILQAEVELQREELKLKQSRNMLDQTWRDLIAFVGIPDMQPALLVGSFEPASEPVEWNGALEQLLTSSPQVIAAQQKIRHDELAVQRERAEPIPNLTLDVTVGSNAETNQTVAGVSAGMPIPVFNRNRGTIRQAQADLNRSHAEVDRLQLELRAELAKQYSDYVSAWQRVTEYKQTMLPKSRNAVQMLEKSYKDRRAPWTSVLSAKRMLLEMELEQIENVLSFQMADVAIRGNLLTGGLTEPAGPISGGHIDAVAQPR
jgi:cobalt-zinc-cadmium efflux system outer membrane protein